MRKLFVGLMLCFSILAMTQTLLLAQVNESRAYKVLATNKTSTMQKELNEAADAGYRFEGVSGGETTFSGSEVVTIMSKPVKDDGEKNRYQYKLLATNKTSTMQKEIQDAGNLGFEYRGQTVFGTMFGGKEVVIILEKDKESPIKKYDYKLLATNKTSTMQKELSHEGESGYTFVGITVGQTAFGGSEVVVILRRESLTK